MQSINHIMIMGNLGADPELFHSKTGKAYCRFSVATNHARKLETGENQSIATWHRVKVFGKTAEHCSTYLRKGSMAVVDGYMSNQTYKKSDGTDGFSSEIVGQHVSFISSPRTFDRALEGRKTLDDVAIDVTGSVAARGSRSGSRPSSPSAGELAHEVPF